MTKARMTRNVKRVAYLHSLRLDSYEKGYYLDEEAFDREASELAASTWQRYERATWGRGAK